MEVAYIEDVNHVSKTNAIDLGKKGSDEPLEVELNEYLTKFLDISENSKDTDKKEKDMSLKEGLKTFPKAVTWSVILSSTLIMEGYDKNLINSLYTVPAFAEKYGDWFEDSSQYQIPAKWQIALSMGAYAGEIIGLFIAGIIADRIGYRKTLMGGLALVTGLIFIVFFATNRGMLLGAQILLGIPWGAFQTLSVTYASEVCPLALRLYLTTYANCCWVIGQLISAGVLRGFVSNNSELAYRIPFAIQWVWPIPIIIGIFFAPESPWWLIRKEKYIEAKNSIRRLLSINKNLLNKEAMAEAMLNKMKMTLRQESDIAIGSYLDCFKGTDLRRTMIASVTWLVQSCTGSALIGYSSYFYRQAGLAASMSFTFTIIQYCLGIAGTLTVWLISQRAGRFTIYFYGLSTMFGLLFVVGCLGISNTEETAYAAGSFLLIYTFVYNTCVGSMCYCIVTEIPSIRLRAKTVVIARNVYNVSSILVSVITPYMLNPTEWNWKAKTGFFWSGFALLSAIWCWFELPETEGRTFAELDQLFHEKTNARNFKKKEVEVFNAERLFSKFGKEGIKTFIDQRNTNLSDKA
ncbi:unnamed protein product [Debaryomyces tyrocola]|nr:unnamed protein product [Debaryomyces tyrocola]